MASYPEPTGMAFGMLYSSTPIRPPADTCTSTPDPIYPMQIGTAVMSSQHDPTQTSLKANERLYASMNEWKLQADNQRAVEKNSDQHILASERKERVDLHARYASEQEKKTKEQAKSKEQLNMSQVASATASQHSNGGRSSDTRKRRHDGNGDQYSRQPSFDMPTPSHDMMVNPANSQQWEFQMRMHQHHQQQQHYMMQQQQHGSQTMQFPMNGATMGMNGAMSQPVFTQNTVSMSSQNAMCSQNMASQGMGMVSQQPMPGSSQMSIGGTSNGGMSQSSPRGSYQEPCSSAPSTSCDDGHLPPPSDPAHFPTQASPSVHSNSFNGGGLTGTPPVHSNSFNGTAMVNTPPVQSSQSYNGMVRTSPGQNDQSRINSNQCSTPPVMANIEADLTGVGEIDDRQLQGLWGGVEGELLQDLGNDVFSDFSVSDPNQTSSTVSKTQCQSTATPSSSVVSPAGGFSMPLNEPQSTHSIHSVNPMSNDNHNHPMSNGNLNHPRSIGNCNPMSSGSMNHPMSNGNGNPMTPTNSVSAMGMQPASFAPLCSSTPVSATVPNMMNGGAAMANAQAETQAQQAVAMQMQPTPMQPTPYMMPQPNVMPGYPAYGQMVSQPLNMQMNQMPSIAQQQQYQQQQMLAQQQRQVAMQQQHQIQQRQMQQVQMHNQQQQMLQYQHFMAQQQQHQRSMQAMAAQHGMMMPQGQPGMTAQQMDYQRRAALQAQQRPVAGYPPGMMPAMMSRVPTQMGPSPGYPMQYQQQPGMTGQTFPGYNNMNG